MRPAGCGLGLRTMMAMPLRHVLNSSSVILLSAEPELYRNSLNSRSTEFAPPSTLRRSAVQGERNATSHSRTFMPPSFPCRTCRIWDGSVGNVREKAMQPSEEGCRASDCAHRDSIFCRKRFRCLPWEVLASVLRQTSASAPLAFLSSFFSATGSMARMDVSPYSGS